MAQIACITCVYKFLFPCAILGPDNNNKKGTHGYLFAVLTSLEWIIYRDEMIHWETFYNLHKKYQDFIINI